MRSGRMPTGTMLKIGPDLPDKHNPVIVRVVTRSELTAIPRDRYEVRVIKVMVPLLDTGEVSGNNLGDVSFTAKVDCTGDAINPTSHDANGASFTGLNVAAGHSLVVYRGGTVWFTITAEDSGDNEE